MQALKFLFYYLRKLRKRQFFCFAICGSSASTNFFVLLFAEAPQALKFLFCHLRKLRKRQIFCFVICGSSASTNFFVLPFAEAPQAPIFLFCHLRKLRKRQFFCFIICGSSASVKTFIFTFAERRCVFGMVGAVPMCPPERPRSGVSIPKYICASRIIHEDSTMDAPLQGDTGGHIGTAPTHLHHALQSAHDQRPLRPRSCNTIHHLEMNERPGKPYIILNSSCRETRITRPHNINKCRSKA